MYACLAVTCHLHFWQNDRDFLRATVVTRGWNGYRNKSQHRKSTLEKKILPPFQQGFEPATFQSRVRRSNHWAIPAPWFPRWWVKPVFYTVYCTASVKLLGYIPCASAAPSGRFPGCGRSALPWNPPSQSAQGPPPGYHRLRASPCAWTPGSGGDTFLSALLHGSCALAFPIWTLRESGRTGARRYVKFQCRCPQCRWREGWTWERSAPGWWE